MKKLIKEFKGMHPIKQAADILAVIVIASGIIVSIYMNMVGRSLWVDEAMLAYSFSKRSLLELSRGVFEWEQSSPLLFLYFTKILTLLVGNTEAVLRSVSVGSYIITIFLTVYLSRSLFRVEYSLQAGAVLANINFMLQYSNMFKQYMSECIWVLLVLLFYKLYNDKKLNHWGFMAACMVFIWGANPACFMMGGVLLYEFFEGVAGKDRGKIQNTFKIAAGIGLSFVVYYFYWLRDVANSVAMQEYWQNADFPLIPRSLQDIAMARAMIYEIFITFREGRILVMLLTSAGLLIGIIWERDRYVRSVFLGFIVALFASFIHMFPVADRLWCFSFPIFVMLSFVAVDRMGQGSTRAMVGALSVCVVLVSSCNGISVYRRAENVFMPGEEANIPIEYIKNNIQEDDSVYVFNSTVPVASYKLGYDAESIDGKGRIYWGKKTFDKDGSEADIELVTGLDSCYILASHAPEERISRLFDACRSRGYLQTVINYYDTPLYYYTKDPARVKASASLELIDREDEDGTCYATIRVTNTGNTIINAPGDEFRLQSRDREDIGTNLWGNLMPGDSFDMPVYFEWGDSPSIELELCQPAPGEGKGKSEGYLWYSSLGCSPVVIEKNQ